MKFSKGCALGLIIVLPLWTLIVIMLLTVVNP